MLKNRFLKKIIQHVRALKKKKTCPYAKVKHQINEIENKNEEMIFEYSNLQGY